MSFKIKTFIVFFMCPSTKQKLDYDWESYTVTFHMRMLYITVMSCTVSVTMNVYSRYFSDDGCTLR